MEPIVLAWRRAGKLGSCRISLKRRLRNQASFFFVVFRAAAIGGNKSLVLSHNIGDCLRRAVVTKSTGAACRGFGALFVVYSVGGVCVPHAAIIYSRARNGFEMYVRIEMHVSCYTNISTNLYCCNKALGVLRSYRARRL